MLSIFAIGVCKFSPRNCKIMVNWNPNDEAAEDDAFKLLGFRQLIQCLKN